MNAAARRILFGILEQWNAQRIALQLQMLRQLDQILLVVHAMKIMLGKQITVRLIAILSLIINILVSILLILVNVMMNLSGILKHQFVQKIVRIVKLIKILSQALELSKISVNAKINIIGQ